MAQSTSTPQRRTKRPNYQLAEGGAGGAGAGGRCGPLDWLRSSKAAAGPCVLDAAQGGGLQ